jgi:lipopolysaccharide transport system ATP-binding protein
MSDIAIRVEHLSKRYRLGEREPYKSLRDVLARAVSAPFKRPNGKVEADPGYIWALDDVSFEVKQGEAVGIIGRNGAGKSTLLKVLSRITKPTKGRAEIYGRVGSLLEVGTGFHPELTGRENIYLNGAILGMKRPEIQKKFDEIVAFAEIEQFLDTPVKRYSSGMYVRLAFAVAAHLEPEILLVDEVLAVGDAAFQKKCLGKMGEVAQQGRTVLFVSHNMGAIQNLCPMAIFITKGKINCFDVTDQVINNYTKDVLIQTKVNLNDYRPRWAKPYISKVAILSSAGKPVNNFSMGENIIINVHFKCPDNLYLKRPVLGITIHHTSHGTVGGVNMRMTGFNYVNNQYKSGIIQCRIMNLPLLHGDYIVDVWLGDTYADYDAIQGYFHFSIIENDIYGTGNPPFARLGVNYLQPEWQILDE